MRSGLTVFLTADRLRPVAILEGLSSHGCRIASVPPPVIPTNGGIS